jgi:hypothetical protein
LIQSPFSYLQLFYLDWLFLIGIYFQFHPLLFDFLDLFSNFIIVLLIFICFILNYFLDWFFFQFHPWAFIFI